MDKQLYGYKNWEKNNVIYDLYRMTEVDKNELKEYWREYNQNKLMKRVKHLKEEVLEYYLRNELKNKDDFEFILFQIEEYYSVENVLRRM